MLVSMTSNEQALFDRFPDRNVTNFSPLPISAVFLIFYSKLDIEYVLDGCREAGAFCLPVNWYRADIASAYQNEHGSNTSFAIFFKSLTASVEDSQLVIPVYASDFFMLKRFGLLALCPGYSVKVLSRARYPETAVTEYLDQIDLGTDEIGPLDESQFEWLLNQSFAIGYNMATISAFLELNQRRAENTYFGSWRRDPGKFYSLLLGKSELSVLSVQNAEPDARADREKRLNRWLCSKSQPHFEKLYGTIETP